MTMVMADFLSSETADYTTTELQLESHIELLEVPQKHQIIHRSDGGTVKVVSIVDDPWYIVTLQWVRLLNADAETLLDLWNDPLKVNGMENTFYWHHPHPSDSNIYTARFMTDMNKILYGGITARQGIGQMQLMITGTKP